ncbi:hypothetical protein HYH03_012559 [Edaphochlamys debaryana]|uniref:Ankyrin repeat protein n=1 Tax=Edaphochlamys debaryana TaxID=47281 RepID=A0A836BVD6_9CHLO|nr:hypothetical protein HYH03_012559 [Edaphochlamys debaryana]|eukprot:KAG2488938.1 hypothetical protein HYH03_012559 [Edaphochlamys debaryana]
MDDPFSYAKSAALRDTAAYLRSLRAVGGSDVDLDFYQDLARKAGFDEAMPIQDELIDAFGMDMANAAALGAAFHGDGFAFWRLLSMGYPGLTQRAAKLTAYMASPRSLDHVLEEVQFAVPTANIARIMADPMAHHVMFGALRSTVEPLEKAEHLRSYEQYPRQYTGIFRTLLSTQPALAPHDWQPKVDFAWSVLENDNANLDGLVSLLPPGTVLDPLAPDPLFQACPLAIRLSYLFNKGVSAQDIMWQAVETGRADVLTYTQRLLPHNATILDLATCPTYLELGPSCLPLLQRLKGANRLQFTPGPAPYDPAVLHFFTALLEHKPEPLSSPLGCLQWLHTTLPAEVAPAFLSSTVASAAIAGSDVPVLNFLAGHGCNFHDSQLWNIVGWWGASGLATFLQRRNVPFPGQRPRALVSAILAGEDEIAELMLRHGADPDAPNMRDGDTPLLMAIRTGNVRAVRALLAAGADIYKYNRVGETPLYRAAAYGHADIVAALIERGANPDLLYTYFSQRNALRVAANYGRSDVVRVLLDAKAMHHPDEFGRGPLHLAAARGNDNVVRQLSAAGAAVDAADDALHTPLMVAAAHHPDPWQAAVVRELIAAGANVNLRDAVKTNTSALGWAVRFNASAEVVRALAKAGADTEARDKDGLLPVHWALALQLDALTKVLLPYRPKGAEPLGQAAEATLLRAVQSGDLDLADLLIGAGAGKKAADEKGLTPLHHAAKAGSMRADGWTPLHYAVQADSEGTMLAGKAPLEQGTPDFAQRVAVMLSSRHPEARQESIETAPGWDEEGAGGGFDDDDDDWGGGGGCAACGACGEDW